MTAKKYLLCTTCKSYVYVCENGRLESRPQQMNDIAAFIEDHEHECEGDMQVWDECLMPPDELKPGGNIYERIYPYKDYYGSGREPFYKQSFDDMQKEIDKLTDMLKRTLGAIEEGCGPHLRIDWFNLDIQDWWKKNK